MTTFITKLVNYINWFSFFYLNIKKNVFSTSKILHKYYKMFTKLYKKIHNFKKYFFSTTKNRPKACLLIITIR